MAACVQQHNQRHGHEDVGPAGPPSAKAITALLREARSRSRRADKLSDTAAAVDNPTTHVRVKLSSRHRDLRLRQPGDAQATGAPLR